MNGAGAGEDALGEGVGLGVDLQDPGLIASFDAGDDTHDDDGGRGNAETDEGELPLGHKGNDEGRHKRRQALEGEAELLGDASLNQLAVGGCLCGNGAAGAKVVVGNLLAEGGAKVGVTDVADDAVCRVGQEDVVGVGQDEPANAQVDKVQSATKLIFPS